MRKYFTLLFVLLTFLYVGCNKEENPSGNNTNNTDIPADPTGIVVPATTLNNLLPTASFAKTSGNPNRIQLNLTGMVIPGTNTAINLVANQNFFLTEDNIVQGVKLTKVSTGSKLAADVVFTVDNSGSMGEEADSIAASIVKFAKALEASGLDVKFACVGYYGYVNGAINFTTAAKLEEFLNRSYGTSRTEQFGGPDSAKLVAAAQNFHKNHGYYDENGVVGVLFADSVFTWRTNINAQRVIINFTDESTQPSNQYEWSTDWMCKKLQGKATVHTVWSGGNDTANAYNWQTLYNERPWDMSKCTGGVVTLVPYNAQGLDLSKLPITGALTASYKVEFVTTNPNVPHTVVITVKETQADGKQTYTNVTY